MNKKQEGKEIIVKEENAVIMAGNPEAQLAFGQRASNALMQVIEAKPKKVVINGEQYLEFEDWQVIGRFFGASVKIAWTQPIMRMVGKDETKREVVWGYEARAVVIQNGAEISSAESMCTRAEHRWEKRDEFQIRSMAQTRACSKAFRTAFSWVAVLKGFKTTPAEEMDGIGQRVETPNPTYDHAKPETSKQPMSADEAFDQMGAPDQEENPTPPKPTPTKTGEIMATTPQLNLISGLRDKAGLSKDQFVEKYGEKENITKYKASEIIEELNNIIHENNPA